MLSVIARMLLSEFAEQLLCEKPLLSKIAKMLKNRHVRSKLSAMQQRCDGRQPLKRAHKHRR